MTLPHVSVRRSAFAAALLSVFAMASVARPAGVATVLTGADDNGETTLALQHRQDRVVPFERFNMELTLFSLGADPAAVKSDLDKRLAAAFDGIRKLHDVEVSAGAVVPVRQTPDKNPG